MADTPHEVLTHYLTDLYSLEQQALVQMQSAPKIAGSGRLSQHFQEHLVETEQHAELVGARLEATGGSRSRVKDAIMKLGGKGFVLFARVQPDTPGKLTAHGFSYEALEFAGYELLLLAADRAGDPETVRVGTTIREQERAMRDRLASDFDEAVDASLKRDGSDPMEAITTYLKDAHALEAQSVELLKRSTNIAGSDDLKAMYANHQRESERQSSLLEERLRAYDSDTSSLKDAGLRLGALNWGLFFSSLKDTPAKLAAFAYAVEHLEIAGYELLKRVASRAGDPETVSVCEQILTEERAMADRVHAALGQAFAAS